MNWTIFFAVLGAVVLLGGVIASVAWATDKIGEWVFFVFVALICVGLATFLGLVV